MLRDYSEDFFEESKRSAQSAALKVGVRNGELKLSPQGRRTSCHDGTASNGSRGIRRSPSFLSSLGGTPAGVFGHVS